jgi:hypothetical protein
MATTGLLSSLLLAALGVTAAAFALYDHFAPQSANAQLSASATAAAPSLPLAVRSRTRFVLPDARPVAGAAVKAKAAVKPHAKAVDKAVDKTVDKDKRRPSPQSAALPWPFNLMQ